MLSPGIHLIERPGALHFYDGHRVVSLTCADEARMAITTLAQASANTTRLVALAERCGIDIDTARQLLALLGSLAVLDGAADALDGPAPDSPTNSSGFSAEVTAAAQFSRATIPAEISEQQAAHRLSTAVVHVVGDQSVTDALSAQLRRSGLNAHPRTLHALEDASAIGADELVVCDTVVARRVNELSLQRGFAWYPIGHYDGAVMRVGPLILPGRTACYECLLSRLSSNVEYSSIYRDVIATAPAAAGPPALSTWATSIATLSLVRWVAGRDPAMPGLLHTLTAVDMSIRSATVYRVPRCPSCSTPDYVPAAAPWEVADVD